MQTLYHASPKKHLTSIDPKRTLSNDIYIGDFVFATSDIRLAAMYLATKGTAILMSVKSTKPRIVICGDSEGYLSKDEGGAIYTVPSTTFKRSPQQGLEESEVVSKVSVRPTSKKVYPTSIDAMKEMGIDIYFVNEAMFNKIIESKDEEVIVSKLESF